MFIEAITVAAVSLAAPPPEGRFQVLGGPAFESLLRQTERRCPGSAVRYASPSAMLDVEDDFTSRLGRPRQGALRHAIPRTPDGSPRPLYRPRRGILPGRRGSGGD